MLESNTQGHGTIKKLRTGAVISTLAISALGVSTVVSASETEVAVNEPATKVVAKDEVVPKVPTQADVDTAKANSEKANQDVAKQKEVVTSTEANIATAEKTIAETTKKVEEAKSVTPEKVAEAKADADKKASELATAEKTVSDAEKSVFATSEKVADQTKVVSEAEKTATESANKVADAQKKVDSLSSTTDVAPLEKEVATLTNQIKADTQSVETAQTNLDNAKKAQSNKDQTIKDAQSGVSQAESNLNDAKSALANAKTNKAEKDKAVTTTQTALNKAKEELKDAQVTNDIPVSNEFIALLKEYAEAPTVSQELRDRLIKAGNKEMINHGYVGWDGSGVYNYLNSAFNSKAKDVNTPVDVNHLTKEQNKEITLFAVDLINKIRARFGTTPLVVTEDMIRIADEATKASKVPDNHDMNALDKVTEANGLQGYSEDISFDFDTPKTMDQLKRAIYQGIILMMFNDSDSGQGHSLNLTQLDRLKSESTKQYMGVAARSTSEYGLAVHYLGHIDNGREDATHFNKSKVIVADSAQLIKQAQDQVASAQKVHDDAVKSANTASQGVSNAEAVVSAKTTALADAKKQLSDLQNKVIDIPSLEKALADAKDKLAQDTQALQTAKEVLALAKSNAIDKAKSLAEAKAALKTAKEEKVSADKALATAKGELEVLTKAHDVAVLARKSAGQDLFRKREASKEATDTYTVLELDLTKRDEVLKALNKELTDTNSKLGVLRTELKTAKEELARLEGIAEDKARILANLKQLKAEHDAYLAEQQRLQALKDKEDAIRKAGGQPKEVTDANGKVVDVVDAKAQNKVVVATVGTKDDKTYQAPAQATNAKAEPKKQLPNTGTKETMLGLLGFGLLAGLGLGYTKKNLRK